MLRLDPDYLLLGEIRDAATARAATDAATSGKGLMSTLHSRDAAGVVSVLRNYGLNDQEISANLSVVVSQRLVRTLCTACREQQPATADERRWLKSVGVEPPEEVWHPVGCDQCRGVGFAGRTGVFEVWRIDDEDYTLLLEHADERSLQHHLAGKGHSFLLDDALEKARRGVTSLSEIRTMGGFGTWSQAARLV
jgi:type II secretory ATPase GspE/PulE/Tfp pilus assembly ATPase PilB-like protein